jgi:hypothetical protein
MPECRYRDLSLNKIPSYWRRSLELTGGHASFSDNVADCGGLAQELDGRAMNLKIPPALDGSDRSGGLLRTIGEFAKTRSVEDRFRMLARSASSPLMSPPDVLVNASPRHWQFREEVDSLFPPDLCLNSVHPGNSHRNPGRHSTDGPRSIEASIVLFGGIAWTGQRLPAPFGGEARYCGNGRENVTPIDGAKPTAERICSQAQA